MCMPVSSLKLDLQQVLSICVLQNEINDTINFDKNKAFFVDIFICHVPKLSNLGCVFSIISVIISGFKMSLT